ncbi:MAG: hypothetical protein IT249_01085 [Chitinophagaceae bacterium]|nr:hypothetical protein [Chitinophagaceae bacterium]
MGSLKALEVEFPSVVMELLHLRIKEENVANPIFEYSITDTEKKICRKGKFNGFEVQLRVAHLNSGKYFFNLNITNGQSVVYTFEKRQRIGNDMVEFLAS